MNSAGKPTGIEAALEVARRRRWLALVGFGLTFALITSIVVVLPDTYKASVTLLVESQQVPQEFVRSTVTSAVERRVQTISQSIMSRERLETLIRTFGLYTDLKERLLPEEVVERMRKDTSVELKGFDQRGGANTTIAFTVSFHGSDPQKVALVANTLASSYIEEDLKTRERQAGGTAEFLQSQLEEMKRKLDAQEKEVSEYKEKYMGELPEQRDGNLATLESLNSQLLLNSEKQIRARESKAIIERQLASAENPDSSSRPDAKIAKIAKLNQELAELRRTYSDKYPDVIRAQKEIARLQQQLDSPAAQEAPPGSLSTIDPYVLQLQQGLKAAEAELRVLGAEEANLHKAIALYQERVENAPRREQEFQELSRDYRTTQDVYASLLKRYEESKLAESMEHRQKGEQFRVLDPAITPERPYAPNRPRLLLFALVLSAALAAGLVAIAETFDTSFHELDELRAFSKVPVLASIPLIVTPADRRGARRRLQAAVVSSVLLLGVVIGASYAIAHGNEWLVGLISR